MAKAAFLCEELDFRPGSEAFVIRTDRQGSPTGHHRVKVKGVAGITGTGQAVFHCETDDGEIEVLEEAQLHTKKQLVFDDSGNLNAYGKWLMKDIEHLRQKALTPPGPPVDVTMPVRI